MPLVYHMYEQINPETGKPYGFGTPSGKVELRSSILEELGFDPVTHYEEPNFSPYSTPEYAEKYPYILITSGRVQPYYHPEHRQIPSLRAQHPDSIVEMNPETAQLLNPPVADGDWVWLENHMGRVKMRARVTPAVGVGILSAEHNWWFPEKDPTDPCLFGVWGLNINVLLDDDPDIAGEELGEYTNKNAMCTVYKA